jgi:hypothetical protein
VTATEREARQAAAAASAPEPVAVAAAVAAEEIGVSLEKLRCIGTVLALESARVAGAPAVRTAALLERFHTGLGELESALGAWPGAHGGNGNSAGSGHGDAGPTKAELRERWRRLLEAIESVERRLEEVEER